MFRNESLTIGAKARASELAKFPPVRPLSRSLARRNALDAGGSVKASVKVTNTGRYDGDETVQLYIHDVYSSMTRPVKELKAFRKVHVEAGQTVEVTFEITPDMLSWYYVDPYGKDVPQQTLEAGEFEIMIGPDSVNLQTLMLNVSEK